MASVSINTTITSTIGGEEVRFSAKRALTAGDAKHDLKAIVADDNGTAVLWASASSPITDWDIAIIVVDPDNVYADGAAAAQVTIELAGSTDTIALRARREAPLIISADDIGSDIDNLDETIETITAKNQNAADAGDVAVRILLFSAAV